MLSSAGVYFLLDADNFEIVNIWRLRPLAFHQLEVGSAEGVVPGLTPGYVGGLVDLGVLRRLGDRLPRALHDRALLGGDLLQQSLVVLLQDVGGAVRVDDNLA